MAKVIIKPLSSKIDWRGIYDNEAFVRQKLLEVCSSQALFISRLLINIYTPLPVRRNVLIRN